MEFIAIVRDIPKPQNKKKNKKIKPNVAVPENFSHTNYLSEMYSRDMNFYKEY